MIPLEEALKSRFSTSTRAELLQYAKEAGHKHAPNIKTAQLLEGLLVTLGQPAQQSALGIQPRRVAARSSEVIPPYNMTPNGVWGGRRHRLKLHKPADAAKGDEGAAFQWNGKPHFTVVFNEPVDVPEPIYNRMVELQRGEAYPETLANGEIITAFKFKAVHGFQYIGVTPGTEHLCGSIKEFYEAKGPGWFRGLGRQEMNQIAALIEKPTTIGRGDKERPLTDEELLGQLLQEFFSWADAVDAEEPEKALA